MILDIRPEQAGHQMARSIIETAHLMYHNEKALSYLEELIFTLQVEKERRGKMMTVLKQMNSLREIYKEP